MTLIGAVSHTAFSQDGENPDPFFGRLYAPNIILEHQSELDLSDSQRAMVFMRPSESGLSMVSAMMSMRRTTDSAAMVAVEGS